MASHFPKSLTVPSSARAWISVEHHEYTHVSASLSSRLFLMLCFDERPDELLLLLVLLLMLLLLLQAFPLSGGILIYSCCCLGYGIPGHGNGAAYSHVRQYPATCLERPKS